MYKCKICGKKFTDISALYNHIEHKHGDMVPKDMSTEQYYYFMKTGKRNGNCVMCKQPTTWNKNTHKYNRFCGNPNCKEKYVQIVKGRMVAKYGKVHLLNDPNKQREMLANRKISGKYRWEGSHIETTYTGTYELDFLKLLDIFFDWDPEDISMPSPHTYTYEYEGEQKFYIPDAFIHSLDLEIEIKDGGDNPNNHHKIQAVDKEKERLKDEVMTTQKLFHYVKITNKNYSNFFDFLKEVKDGFEKYGDDKKIPRIFKTEDIKTKSVVNESWNVVEEVNMRNGYNQAMNVARRINDRMSRNSYADHRKVIEFNFNSRINNMGETKEYLLRLAKNFNHEKDQLVIKDLVRKSYVHYSKMAKNNPNLEKDYYDFKKWAETKLPKEIRGRLKDLRESTEYSEDYDDIIEEKFEPDKFLIWFDKPLKKLTGGKIKVYHGSLVDIQDKEIKPISYNVGATKFSDPRWSTYIWDNREDALDWAIVWAVSNFHKETMMMGHNGKNLIGIPKGMEEKDFILQLMEKMRGFKFYVYECETDIKNLEIGSCPSIKEYTVSEKLPIVKKYEYMINRELLKRFFTFVSMEEIMKRKQDRKTVKNLKLHRGWFFNKVLDNSRDSYRAIMRTDFQNGNITYDDDLSFYKDIINHHVKLDTYKLKENVVYESSISLAYINNCLQNEYNDLLDQYLKDYTDFYHKMMKERPDAVHHINDDIKKAIVFIDGLSKKGEVSNDLLKSAKWCLGDLVNLNKHTKPPQHSKHTQSLVGTSIATESFRKEHNGNIWVGADWHFYTKYNDRLVENPNIDKIINNFNRKIKPNDIVIFLGDLYDARRIHDKKEMPNLDKIKRLKGYKIFVKGNHDVDPDKKYYDLGFDIVTPRHEIGNLVFTHEPVNVNENQINIHGHLHYCRDYWYIKPTSHIDVYTARFKYQPISVNDAVEKYNDGVMKPLAINTFNETFGKVTTTESTQVDNVPTSTVKVKVLYNPDSKTAFSLNDKSSQVMINEHYVIQRDLQGTKCSITQGQCDETNKKVLEFDIVYNESLNIDVLIKEKIESGIQICSLFNPDDMENRFIREMSMKLFGIYPDKYDMYR